MKRLINLQPAPPLRFILGLLPLVLLVLLYVWASDARLAANPVDKLLPSLGQFADAIKLMAWEPDKRSGDILLWVDTLSSLQRLAIGIALSALFGLMLGLVTGALPLVNAGFSPLLTLISLIPPMAILPILFIVFGLGELSKVALILVGVGPIIARDMQRQTREIPFEQLVKAQTLGANSLQILTGVLLPQLLPRLIGSIRLALGTGWLFLIAAEAIASTDGLGYRIFLVRRYMAMDIILPYVAWIALLALIIDQGLMRLNRRLFPWYQSEGGR
ncbi:MAG: ABC transporter permease subunit [Gammaproteobacteria bacterium]|nr:ABC transporter permease subunit [Gammaproteobacteria bacterium]